MHRLHRREVGRAGRLRSPDRPLPQSQTSAASCRSPCQSRSAPEATSSRMHPSKEAQQVSQSNLRATSKSSPRRDRERADAPPKALLPPGSFTQPPLIAFRSGKAPRLSPPARTNAVTGREDCIFAGPVTRHAYARDAGTRDLSAAPSSRCAGSRLVSTTITSRSRAAGCGISASSWSRARAERECPTRRVRSERSNPANGAPARTGAVLLSNTRL